MRVARPGLNPSHAYSQIGVETGVTGASPHQLVTMLFDGLLESLTRARGALHSGNIEVKTRELSRAARIVEEGLKASLSPAGGELSVRLSGLYAYVGLRLTQANRHNDETAIDECVHLIEPLREAWMEIRPQVDGATGRS